MTKTVFQTSHGKVTLTKIPKDKVVEALEEAITQARQELA